MIVYWMNVTKSSSHFRNEEQLTKYQLQQLIDKTIETNGQRTLSTVVISMQRISKKMVYVLIQGMLFFSTKTKTGEKTFLWMSDLKSFFWQPEHFASLD